MAKVTHEELLEKIVDHEQGLARMGSAIESINQKLDPIVTGIRSIAFAFKALLVLGAGSAAVTGILVLLDRF